MKEWTAPFLLKSDAETAQALAAQAKVKANLAKAIPLESMFAESKASPRKRGEWAEKTERSYRFRIDAFLKWMSKNHPAAKSMADVSTEIAEEYVSTVVAAVSCPARYNDTLSMFSSCWNILQGKGNGAINPWIDIKRKRVEDSGREPFTDEEVKKIIANAKGEWRTLFCLAVYTDQRLGDCCAFKWEDVNLEGCDERGLCYFNPFKQRKTGRTITHLPIHPALLAELEKTPKDKRTGLIIPGMNYRYQHGTIDSFFRNYLKRLGIYKSKQCGKKQIALKTFHSFRHTAFSKAVNSGLLSFDSASKVSGHLSKEAAERYYHEDDETKRNFIFSLPDYTSDGNQKGETLRKRRIDRLNQLVEGWTKDEIQAAIAELQKKID